MVFVRYASEFNLFMGLGRNILLSFEEKNMAEKVCTCYDVTKADLVRAIRKHKLDSFFNVQAATKASTGCGRCKPIVMDILEKELKNRLKSDSQLRLPL